MGEEGLLGCLLDLREELGRARGWMGALLCSALLLLLLRYGVAWRSAVQCSAAPCNAILPLSGVDGKDPGCGFAGLGE